MHFAVCTVDYSDSIDPAAWTLTEILAYSTAIHITVDMQSLRHDISRVARIKN